MIRITPERSISPHAIVSAEIERRFYMNGSATYLVIKLSDGETIRIGDSPSTDVYAIKKRIDES